MYYDLWNKVHKRSLKTNNELLSAFAVHIPFRIGLNTIKALTLRGNYFNEVPFDRTAVGNKTFTSNMKVSHWLESSVLVDTDRPIFLH